MTVLYRFFDAGDRLLYVGIAANPVFRWEAHHRTPWWKQARHVTLEHLPSRTAALAAEAVAIRTEHPQWNGRQGGSSAAPRKSSGYLEIADSLRSRIGPDKEFPPGTQLPTREALRTECSVSEITIDAAMRELRRDGLTETVHGRGVFVREQPENPPIGQ